MSRAEDESGPGGTGEQAPVVRAPATRDQADAYRFGVRRLESALVRADPVPAHEHLRAQRRAAVAGVLVGLLALGGVAVWALVSPRPDWRAEAIVVGERSGAVYVVADRERLVPVANLAAARLVLAALRAGGSVAPGDAAVAPVVVPDDTLAAAPRTATSAVRGAVAVDPGGPVIDPRWTVCDTVEESGTGSRLAGTAVVAGAAGAAGLPGAVHVAGPDGATWLVADGRRHALDAGDEVVAAVLGLRGRPPRPISAGLLSAVPEGTPLVTPEIAGAGGPAPQGLPGRVGDVLVTRSVGGTDRHHVVLTGGVQEVPPTLAAVLGQVAARPDLSGSGATLSAAADRTGIRTLDPGALAGVPELDRLDVEDWPVAAPQLLEPAAAPVLCWVWSGEPGAPATGAATALTAVPAPADGVRIALAGADGAGDAADAVHLPAGGGGAVRATGPGGPAGAGTLWLVSATGVAHGVADDPTAEALGITVAPPAPELALRLLPRGELLDLSEAREIVDVLPSRPGG